MQLAICLQFLQKKFAGEQISDDGYHRMALLLAGKRTGMDKRVCRINSQTRSMV